jgi:type I restriction enzyme, S subunit
MDMMKLDDLIDIKHGYAFESVFFSREGDFVLLTPGNFKESGGFQFLGKKQKYYVGYIPEDFILKKGDMLVAMKEQSPGLLGCPIIVPEGNFFLHNQRLGLVKNKRPDILFFDYLYHYFNINEFRNYVAKTSSGTKVKHTSPSRICEVFIPLPPIDEQKKIAEILGTWDEAIGTIEQLIIAKKDLKKALVYKLIINEGSSTKRVSISDVAQINPALEIKLSSRADVTFLGMSDIAEDGGMNEGHIQAYEDVCKGYTAFQEDDILIAKITPCFENNKGTWAKSLVNRTGFGSTEFHVVRCGSSVNPEFLYQITLSKQFRDKGVSFMTGSAGQKRVPTEFIESYRFNLPSLQEQARICSAMNLVDREIDHLIHTKKSIKRECPEFCVSDLECKHSKEIADYGTPKERSQPLGSNAG